MPPNFVDGWRGGRVDSSSSQSNRGGSGFRRGNWRGGGGGETRRPHHEANRWEVETPEPEVNRDNRRNRFERPYERQSNENASDYNHRQRYYNDGNRNGRDTSGFSTNGRDDRSQHQDFRRNGGGGFGGNYHRQQQQPRNDDRQRANRWEQELNEWRDERRDYSRPWNNEPELRDGPRNNSWSRNSSQYFNDDDFRGDRSGGRGGQSGHYNRYQGNRSHDSYRDDDDSRGFGRRHQQSKHSFNNSSNCNSNGFPDSFRELSAHDQQGSSCDVASSSQQHHHQMRDESQQSGRNDDSYRSDLGSFDTTTSSERNNKSFDDHHQQHRSADSSFSQDGSVRSTSNNRQQNGRGRRGGRRRQNSQNGYGLSPYDEREEIHRQQMRRYQDEVDDDYTDPYANRSPADIAFFNPNLSTSSSGSRNQRRGGRGRGGGGAHGNHFSPRGPQRQEEEQRSSSNNEFVSDNSHSFSENKEEQEAEHDKMPPNPDYKQGSQSHRGHGRRSKDKAASGVNPTAAGGSASNPAPSQASSTTPFPPVEQPGAPGEVLVAPKKAPATRAGKETVRLITNFYPLQVESKMVYRYDVVIRVNRGAGEKEIDLTKGARDDAAMTERHQLCLAALRSALELYRVLRDGEAVVHDGAAIMFSSEDLAAALKPHSGTLSITTTDLPNHVRALIRWADVSSIDIELVPCRESAAQFDLANFGEAQSNRDMAHLDRSWKQFYDMLTNQDAVSDGRFTLYGAGKLFKRDGRREDIRNGHELVKGGDKGIKFIEGRKGGPSRAVGALVLDAKVGQFFTSQNLRTSVIERLQSMGQEGMQIARGQSPFPFGLDKKGKTNATWAEINKYIKGLRLNFLNHTSNMHSSFVAIGISKLSVEHIKEKDIKGENQPLMSRFPEQDARTINMQWPAVVFRSMGFEDGNRQPRELHYPMELLTVAPHQRVSLQKQIQPPASAVKADVRYRDISALMNALNLDAGGSHNSFLRAFGIKVAAKPLEVDGIRRAMPAIQYRNGARVTLDKERSNWRLDRQMKYIVGGSVDLLVFAYTCDDNTVKRARDAIMNMMRARGMVITKQAITVRVNPTPTVFEPELNKVFENTKKDVSKMKMVILIDRIDNKSHGWLKLLERKHLILSQQITTELAGTLDRKPASCSNVVNKINCKLSGLNHSVEPDDFGKNRWVSNGKTLIIGYDVAHPGKPDRDELLNKKPPQNPSVVGLSFNGGPHCQSFIGDFHLQSPRMEEVESKVLNARMKWMLGLFIKNRKQWPESIFIVRDGISEGQYRMAIENELGALKEACEEYGNVNNHPGWCPKFLLVIVTKRHNARLFKSNARGFIENPLPGTVVDTDIVRNDMTEFYMQSHRVIQGTGKAPTYQILVDELNMTSDEIQATMLALAFNHQIVESSISLPEPVYQADEWAKRGNEMYKTFSDNFKLLLCKERGDYASAPIDFEAMTNKLAYWHTPMEETRVNA